MDATLRLRENACIASAGEDRADGDSMYDEVELYATLVEEGDKIVSAAVAFAFVDLRDSSVSI
jgi:hypothetical protein